MPRVPTYSEQPVRTEALRAPRAAEDVRGTNGEAIAEGLQNLSQGIAQVAERHRQERSKADAVLITSGVTLFEQGVTEVYHDDKVGLFSQKGEVAFAAETPAWDEINRRAGDIARKHLKTDEQRAIFKQQVDGRLAGLQRQTENYLARERDGVTKSTAFARLEAGKQAVSQGYDVPEVVGDQMASVEASTRAMGAPTGEELEVQVADAKGQIAATAVASAISARSFETAEGLLSQHGALINPEVRAKLQRTLDGVKSERTAESAAKSLVDGVRNSEGWVDEGAAAKALAAVDDIPDELLRKEVRSLVKERLTLADAVQDGQVKQHFRTAHTAYLRGGLKAVDPLLKTWIEDHAPEMWARLKADHETRVAHWKAERSDSAAQRAAAAAQAERNKLARNDFMSKPPDERATLDIATHYAGWGLDAVGLSELGPLKQASQQSVQKGAAVHENEFVREGTAKLQGILSKPKAKAYEAVLRIEFARFERDQKRPPNREEGAKLIGELATKHVEEHWYGDREEFDFERRAKERKTPSGAAPAVAPTPPPETAKPAGKVVIVGPNGQRGSAPAAGLDAWLSKNPGWRKQ